MARHKKKRTTTRHHIEPRSRLRMRDKNKDNVVELDKEFHKNWHQMFENMTVAEVHRFIDRVMTPGERWTYGRLWWLRNEVIDERECSEAWDIRRKKGGE